MNRRDFYFYQILTTFNKLKIMSEVALDNWKRLKLFKSFINYYLIEERISLIFQTKLRVTMVYGSGFQLDITRRKKDCLCLVLQWRIMRDKVYIQYYTWTQIKAKDQLWISKVITKQYVMKIISFLHCNFCALKHCVYRIIYIYKSVLGKINKLQKKKNKKKKGSMSPHLTVTSGLSPMSIAHTCEPFVYCNRKGKKILYLPIAYKIKYEKGSWRKDIWLSIYLVVIYCIIWI